MFKTLLLARTTFEEMVRQPAFFFIFFGVGLVISLTPFFTMFAFYDTNRLLIEMGMASITVMSLVAVSLTASHSIHSEIKRKTALLILTKPVSRLSFLMGKYLGVIACGATIIFFHSILLMMVVRMGAPETAAYVVDQPCVGAIVCIFLFSMTYGFYQNYFNNKSFTAQSVKSAIFIAIFFVLVVGVFDRQWAMSGYWKDFSIELTKGLFLILLSMLVLSGISVMLSAYIGKDSNLIVTFSIFVIGLLSDRYLGSIQESNFFIQTCYRFTPNFHIFLVSDTIVFNRYIPPSYLFNSVMYTVMFLGGLLALSIVLFDRKEVA
jgi:ABC-type transport system involved in multi-copper enzyme maturation permease subunit